MSIIFRFILILSYIPKSSRKSWIFRCIPIIQAVYAAKLSIKD